MTASAGLTYQAVTSTAGSTCNPCMAGSNQWRLTLPTIPAAATTLITLTGQLASNLTTLPVVTRTLRSSAGAIPLSGAAVTHLTDSVPPTVTVLYASPAVLHPGANAVYGQADDGAVIGVAKGEIRPAGATQWQVVTGTALPAFITSNSVPVRFRACATDAAGDLAVGAWQTTTVDTVAPVRMVTTYISRIEPWKYQSPLRTGPPVLTGDVHTVSINVMFTLERSLWNMRAGQP
jgi:hypothetical protein